MRKRIGESRVDRHPGESAGHWLNLEQIATVEVTSEDPAFPIESALSSKDGPGWRASENGEQRIRIIFDQPVPLHRIQLRFHEAGSSRTQEFTVRWSGADGAAREIVRQQWNFNPTGSTTEVEDYAVELEAVSVLELAIKPDISGREAVATLSSWRLG
jgi:hypothetical protein